MASELSISEDVLTDIRSVFSINDSSDYDKTTLDFLAHTISYAGGSVSGEAAENSRLAAGNPDPLPSYANDQRPGIQFLTVLPVLRYFVNDLEGRYGDKPFKNILPPYQVQTRLKQLEGFNDHPDVPTAIRLTEAERDKLAVACKDADVALPPEEEFRAWTWRTYRAFCILWHRYKLARPQKFSDVARINDALSGVTLGLSDLRCELVMPKKSDFEKRFWKGSVSCLPILPGALQCLCAMGRSMSITVYCITTLGVILFLCSLDLTGMTTESESKAFGYSDLVYNPHRRTHPPLKMSSIDLSYGTDGTIASASDAKLSNVFSINASALDLESKEALTAYCSYAQGRVSIAAARVKRDKARATISKTIPDPSRKAGDHRLTLLDTLGYFTGDLDAKVREDDGMLPYDQSAMLKLLGPFNQELESHDKEKHLALTDEELNTLAGACLDAGGPDMKYPWGDRSWNFGVFRAFCILLQEHKRAKLGKADAASMNSTDSPALTS
ncbi:hypothetical protein FFLO_04757 [Filobasidium floriforme]|uniref:Uncharacterized protein n=1 Tax=Filobasidium floriforme TaxID=5210 RepID=A0A8K0NNX6_9TREE|nr:uncharacterized protein HD553DRAFT_357728 [Filobasidium floriforme]KAG7530850.1 hypothetical protein FFLO_04757 [Filobasidium floriforme]KAH8082539.1 hypothetical protein HD553DRAFT_357728 [Filobasidium floriforme]